MRIFTTTYDKERLLIFSTILYSTGFIFKGFFSGLNMVVSVIAVVLFLYALISYRYKLNDISLLLKTKALCTYALISLILTLTWNYDGIRSIILNPALLLPYTIVILTFFSFEDGMPKLILKGLVISAILFIIFSYLNFSHFINGISAREAILSLHEDEISFDTISKNLAACLGWGLILSPFINNKYRLPIIIGFIINILIAIFLGRRNIIFTNSLYIIAAIICYLKFSKVSSFIKSLLWLVCTITISYAAVNFHSYITNSDNPLFQMLSQRLDLDSRGNVLEYWEEDMNSNPTNWIFGKGIDSKYYCPGVEESNYRRTVEAGWRQIIMKVGIIGIILYLSILIPALFTKKRNLLTTACGLYILIGLIELYPAGVPTFYLQYVLLWISASICYDHKYINADSQTITTLLK